MGWELDNHWDLNVDQCVMIAAPHTSNWDALYARLALKALGVNVRLTIKDSYMKLPFGPFVRAMGGIGIDRSVKQAGQERPSMVQLMSDAGDTRGDTGKTGAVENGFLPCRHDGRRTDCFSLYGLCQEKNRGWKNDLPNRKL